MVGATGPCYRSDVTLSNTEKQRRANTEKQRRYRARHPERCREQRWRYRNRDRKEYLKKHRERERLRRVLMRAPSTILRAHMKGRLTPYKHPKPTRHVDRTCKGCKRTFLVASAGRKQAWCSSSCSNKRALKDWKKRFWSKVAIGITAKCWPWTAGRDRHGYGRFALPGGATTVRAPRFAWILSRRKKVPAAKIIMHKCDNPPCCNPSHLRLGTHTQNRRDCVRKGRARFGNKKEK